MRTIIVALIAVLLFGIAAAGFKNSARAKTTILIQAIGKNSSSDLLNQSSVIISKRLKSFSVEKFAVTVISGQHQLQITLPENQDLQVLENLVTQKGVLAFYEAYNRQQFTELYSDNQQLFSLLKPVSDNHSVVIIGCTSKAELAKVNSYLNTSGLDQKCKFAWSKSPQSAEICLYALKPASSESPFPTGSDIESIKYGQENGSKSYTIGIVFNKNAAEVWHEATKRCMNNTIAIVLDNNVIVAPTVRSEISSGRCEISGDFTETEAKNLVALVNNGELPLDFKLVK